MLFGYMSYKEKYNTDRIFENKSYIQLIEINNANHGNILDQEELLAFEISNFRFTAFIVN